MTDDGLLSLCRALPGTWPDQPWGDGVVAEVGAAPGKILAFPGPDPAGVALELEPQDAAELRAAHPGCVGDAPYLSKRHRVRVALDGTVPDDGLEELVAGSYALVVAGLPRGQRPTGPGPHTVSG